MRKYFISAALAAAMALVVGTFVSASDDDSSSRHAKARLSGFEENPSISTTGTGTLDLRIDETAQTIEYELSYEGLEGGTATASHIHVAARGVNGGVSAFLCDTVLANDIPDCPAPSGTVSGVIMPANVIGPVAQGISPGEFAELVRAIRAGYTYVNVHTPRWPGGEIRGQIK